MLAITDEEKARESFSCQGDAACLRLVTFLPSLLRKFKDVSPGISIRKINKIVKAVYMTKKRSLKNARQNKINVPIIFNHSTMHEKIYRFEFIS